MTHASTILPASNSHGGSAAEPALDPSATRPLALRMRADLIAVPQSFRGRPGWVVKDPLTLRYFRFEPEEYALLQGLDGRRSAVQLQSEFQQRFAPQQIALAEIVQFIANLQRTGLVISEQAAQDQVLWARAQRNQARAWRQRWLQLLSFQFPGIDPEPVLRIASRCLGWMFTLGGLLLVSLLWCAAGLLVTTHWEELRQRLPSFRAFFHAGNWIWLALALMFTKIIHELGHGVACRRWGGRVHEMGVLLLLFTPCLYCNVSDSWMIPSKWRRIAIGAAGMYIEWTLAAVCAGVWWWTRDGIVHQLALNTLFVSSVSTFAFNANPLLKYDGYYILSDWLEIPNLRQKSAAACRAIATAAFGTPANPDPFLPTRGRWGLAAYGVAAAIYRGLITYSIFFFLYKVGEPYGLQILGQILAAVVVGGLVVAWGFGGYRWGVSAWRSNMFGSARGWVVLGGGFGAALAILAVPVPHYVRCPVYVRAAHGVPVFVEQAGRVGEILVAPAGRVDAGQPLLRLEVPTLASEIAELEGKRQVARARLTSSHRLLDADRHRFAADVAADQSRTAAYTSLIEQRQQGEAALLVTAPCAGWLFPPEHLPPPSREGTLPTWHGWLLEPRNRGAHAERGTCLGQIVPDGDPLQALLAVDQQDLEFIQTGQSVELWLAAQPDRTLTATVQAVSQVAMHDVPKCLAVEFGGSLPTHTDPRGVRQPRTPTYQIVVPLNAAAGSLPPGASGVARIRVGSRTLGARLWRMICQTIRFEL